jgi:hypothetical protein
MVIVQLFVTFIAFIFLFLLETVSYFLLLGLLLSIEGKQSLLFLFLVVHGLI